MTTDTVLSDAEIFHCFDSQCDEMVMSFDADELYFVGRAIEQAVLQSPEIRALRGDLATYARISIERAGEIQALRSVRDAGPDESHFMMSTSV